MSIINSNRFNLSRGPEIMGPTALNRNTTFSTPDVRLTNDPDIHFLTTIKQSIISFNKIELSQVIPPTPMTNFHLIWFLELALKGISQFDYVTYIISSYKNL